MPIRYDEIPRYEEACADHIVCDDHYHATFDPLGKIQIDR
jgi:hypothetical protein